MKHNRTQPSAEAVIDREGWSRSSTRPKKGWLLAGGVLTALAASAIVNRANAKKAEAETPPAGKFVEVDGVRLHYVDRGAGRTIVLLHGNGVTWQDFEASGVLDLASERYRVIAFDRPGFGYSERPRSTVWTPHAQAALLARALDRLGAGRAIVVGHSWGAMVALAMALDQPQAVAGVVLMSGYYYPTLRVDVVPGALPAIPVAGDVMVNTVSPLLGALIAPVAVKASFAPAPVSSKLAAMPAGLMLRPSQLRATAADTAMMLPAAAALSRRYGELAVPVRIIAGDGDLIAHADRHAARLVNDIAGSGLRIIPGQGHMFHYAAPEEVVTAIDIVAAQS